MLAQAISIFSFFFTASALLIYSYRRATINRLVRERTFEAPEQVVESDLEIRSVLPRFYLMPWMTAVVLSAGIYWMLGFPLVICITIGLMAGLLGSQFEAYLHERRTAKYQVQLADAIDLMVGALGAGAGAMASLAAAVDESPNPLKTLLSEAIARIRMGDDPGTVFSGLSQSVPDETFLLFSSTMAVHWEVGGSLAPTLSMLGRTIRDRIEMSRRIRSNIIQSQASTVLIVVITYFIALLMWNHDPASVRSFVQSTVGLWLIAITMILQAVGVVWMSIMSKMKF